ncbi:MAG: T9SS type A sorting domain-containing protein [Barnesiella sp.]
MKKILPLFIVLAGISAYTCETRAEIRSPYMTKVLEFRPAPGQFINELPEYEEGDTEETMRQKAEDYLAYDARGMVSLGGFGGYIVVGFDHTIVNVAGQTDFKILGNAFYADANPNPGSSSGGSSEPGIVMVAYDANKNGKPDDDEWYELAGSEYYKPETTKNYEITYYRPDENKIPTPSQTNPNLTDTTYLYWKDNQGKDGYLSKLAFHRQSYYPQWIEEPTLTFKGTRLADNGVDESGNDSYYVLYAYDWGYADNHPNSSDKSNFDIDWAVDKNGNKVSLPGIDFVKIYTGVNQFNGWIGECSTEVMGVEDLHVDAEMGSMEENIAMQIKSYPNPCTDYLYLSVSKTCLIELTDITGHCLIGKEYENGNYSINMQTYPAGIYILKAGNTIQKIIKN